MRRSSLALAALGPGAHLLLARAQEPPPSAPVGSSESSRSTASEVASEEITFRSGDITLAGTLTAPLAVVRTRPWFSSRAAVRRTATAHRAPFPATSRSR